MRVITSIILALIYSLNFSCSSVSQEEHERQSATRHSSSLERGTLLMTALKANDGKKEIAQEYITAKKLNKATTSLVAPRILSRENITFSEKKKPYTEITMNKILVKKGNNFVSIQLTVRLNNPALEALFEHRERAGSITLNKIFKAKITEEIMKYDLDVFAGTQKKLKPLEEKLMKIINNIKNQYTPKIKGQIVHIFCSEIKIL